MHVFDVCTYFACTHTLYGCVCIQTFPAWLVCQGCPGWLVVGDKAVAYELAQLLFVSTACFTVNFDYAASLTECVYSLVSQ